MADFVTGNFRFREHVVGGVEKYAKYTQEEVPSLAGRLLAAGIEDLEAVEGGLHGLAKLPTTCDQLFGSGPTSGRVTLPWALDPETYGRYQSWCNANQAATAGVMGGQFLRMCSAEIVGVEGLPDELGISHYTWYQWRMESDRAYLETHGTLSSLRSEEASSGFGGGCLDRDPLW